MSPDILIKLAFLSFLSLAPILAKDRLKALISTSASGSATPLSPLSEKGTIISSEQSERDEKRVSRWTWMKEWKVRLPSRSRTRDEKDRSERMRQLDELADEKQQLRIREEAMLPS